MASDNWSPGDGNPFEKEEVHEDIRRCKHCENTEKTSIIIKCPMCHGYYCDECEKNVGGKKFCSHDCGMLFFWGDEDG